MELRLRPGPDPGWPTIEVAVRGGRIHPGVSGDPRGPTDPVQGGHRGDGPTDPEAGCAGAPAEGQWPGVRRPGAAGMAPGEGCEDALHHPGEAVGECLLRVLSQPVAGRVPEPGGICHRTGGKGPERRVASGL